MFKKTPIALAVLALSSSIAVANQDNDRYYMEKIVGPDDGNPHLISITPNTQASGKIVVIKGEKDPNNVNDQAIAINHKANNQMYLSGFSDLEITSDSDAALKFDSGNLGIGLAFDEGRTEPGRPEDFVTFAPLDSLSIHSDTSSAIRGVVSSGSMGQHSPGQLNIVAKNITITSDSDEATIDMNGVPRAGNQTIDFDAPMIDILRYDEKSWIAVEDKGWDGTGEEDPKNGYIPNIDPNIAKNYGLIDQTLTIKGKEKAINLTNGAAIEIDAGTVDISGNVYLRNGAELSMGYTTNALSILPDAWVSWDGDKNCYVPDLEPNEEGYFELINKVTIQGKVVPTKNNNYQAAVHVEGGSLFFTAANNVSISGTVLDKNTTIEGGHHKHHRHKQARHHYYDKVRGHFGEHFHMLKGWEKHDTGFKDNDVDYGNAIYLATDKSSQYQLAIQGGQMIPTAQPSIVSIWGEETLEINGDIVLDFKDHFSGSLLYIGAAKEAKVLINGDIHVYNDANGDHENTIKLDLHEGHLFIGSIIDHSEGKYVEQPAQPAMFRMARSPMMLSSGSEGSSGSGSATKESSGGTHLRLINNNSTIITGDSVISQVTTDNASIMTVDMPSVTIKQLNLQGDTKLYTFGVKKGQFTIENLSKEKASTYGLGRSGTQDDATLGVEIADMGNATDEEVAQVLSLGSSVKNLEYKLTQNESNKGTKRTVNAKVDGSGQLTVSGEREDNTSVAKAINDVAGLGVMAWRAQMNDVNKRLGDLRTYQGQYGGWARVYGSETKYGDLGLKSESNTVQVGADMKIADNFYFGATASYTDGKGKLNNGSTDDRAYSFGVYGGWMGDDGQFVDVIIKEHNFKTDFDLRYTTNERSTGDFDLWGTSICAEYGWRLNVTDKLWVEPQAEMTYGYMNDVSYEYAGGVKATQEATESLVGRLGVAFGSTFENGSAYVKASVAHDWMGETEISMSNGNAPMKEDLGGTWGEFAIGGTYNFANGWAVYGEFQTAKGSKMKTPYQYNIGARYVF